MSLRARATTWSLAVTTLVLVGSGCSAATPSPPAVTPAVTSTVTSTPTVRAVAPSHTPDPAATPADGTSRPVGPVTLVLPVSFAPTGDTGNDSLRLAQFTSPDPVAIVEVSETSFASADLHDAAAAAIADSPLAPARLEDRDVGGQEVYALSGSDDYTGLYYSVGRSTGGKRIDIAFSFQVDSPENHALIESVLATVQWGP